MSKIPLLDIGNVVVKVDFTPFFTWLCGRSEQKDMDRVRGLLQSSLFYELEFGLISLEGFTNRVRLLYGAAFSEGEFQQNFCNIFQGMTEGMDTAIAELAQAGPVYGLSNTNSLHLSYMQNNFPAFRHFSKIYCSHELHQRKPYPGIYQTVIQELNAEPQNIVFFDDLPANVLGAKRIGLDAHVFSGAEQMKSILLPIEPKKIVEPESRNEDDETS